MSVILKRWGREELIVNNDLYCGKFLRFSPRSVGSLHYHKNKHETFHILSGAAYVEIRQRPYHDSDGMFRSLVKGDTIELPPGTAHRVTAGEQGVVIVEFSTPYSDDDVVRIEPSP